MTSPDDIKALETERDRLAKILTKGDPKSPDYRKAVQAHRQIVDLIERDGGTPQERAWVTKKLTELHEVRK